MVPHISLIKPVEFDTKNDDEVVAVSDAVSVLVNLGYGRSAAFKAVSQAAKKNGNDTSVENLVKAGLKELSA